MLCHALACSPSPRPGASSSVPPELHLMVPATDIPLWLLTQQLLRVRWCAWPQRAVPASVRQEAGIRLHCTGNRTLLSLHQMFPCAVQSGSLPFFHACQVLAAARCAGTAALRPGQGQVVSGAAPLKQYGSMLRSQEGSRSPLSRQASHAGRHSSPSSRRGTVDSLSGASA